jgi:Transglycosylase-like domain
VANPNQIATGQRLRLPASGQVPTRMAHAARAAFPAPSRASAAVSVAQASPPAAAPVSAAAPASSGGANWSAIATCESGGNWSANTGNGFYGGLQFTEQTWLSYGGGQYASSANLATKAQQIAVAERVLAGQGIGAWPGPEHDKAVKGLVQPENGSFEAMAIVGHPVRALAAAIICWRRLTR